MSIVNAHMGLHSWIHCLRALLMFVVDVCWCILKLFEKLIVCDRVVIIDVLPLLMVLLAVY